MSEPSHYCINCKYHQPYDYSNNSDEEAGGGLDKCDALLKTSYVTGRLVYADPIYCSLKNTDGKCKDYEVKE